MRANTWSLLGVGASAVLTVAACGVATPSAGVLPSTVAPSVSKRMDAPLATAPFDDPASDHVIVYDVDLVSGPLTGPPPGSVIDEAAARAAAASAGPTVGPEAQPIAHSATLRMTAPDVASLTPGHLSWIVIWTDTHPMFSRPVGQHWDAGSADCNIVVVVDATTADSTSAAQYCRAVER